MKKCTISHDALFLFRMVAVPIIAALTFFCTVPLNAQKQRISVQGTLKTATGAAVPDGIQPVKFLLYRVKEGGDTLWSEETTVDVVAGIYSHYLGSVRPLNPSHFDSTLFLAVRVGSYELTPRVELAYSPYAFSVAFAQKVVCSGAVGDVKYSVLPPAQFALENGNCWVPMNGAPLPSSKLKEYIPSWNNLPDAGGMFIRGQEFSGGANIDPERNSTTAIAGVQTDAFEEHTHTMEEGGRHRHSMGTRGFATDGSTGVDGSSDDDNLEYTRYGGEHIHEINSTGGAETRPINLNLWVYIRIN